MDTQIKNNEEREVEEMIRGAVETQQEPSGEASENTAEQQSTEEADGFQDALMRTVMERRAAEEKKFIEDNELLIKAFNLGREKSQAEEKKRRAEEQRKIAILQQKMAEQKFFDMVNKPKQNDCQVQFQENPAKQIHAKPLVPDTMAAKKAKKSKRVRVYSVELGSTSSWVIALTLLVALIARLAGAA